MDHRYAILIDGGFFIRKLYSRLKKHPEIEDVVTELDKLQGNERFRSYELIRIYYYDARPATGQLRNPLTDENTDLSKTVVFRRNQSFLDGLEMKPNIALRLGETSANGWKLKQSALRDRRIRDEPLRAESLQMDIEQKGVDLRIGLDIARLSLRHLVKTIVVVTGDSDLVPAFKFARREGVRVILCHMGHGVKRDLRAHTDMILDI